MPDPLDLLSPSSAGPDPQHRRHVLDATLGELRRRRRQRRERRLATIAAALAAVVFFAVLPPVPQTRRALPFIENGPAVNATSAADVEWDALQRPDKAKELYRQAGERYVSEGDFAGAVRSYGGSLDAGTAEDLETNPDDDWLLAVIKIARKKESER